MQFLSVRWLVCLLVLSFLHSQDDGLPPNFVYLEPIEDFYAYNPITIEIIVTDRNALDRVSLFYRFSGNPDYVQREMSVSHQPVVYDVEIPLEEVESGHIQYFFWAKDEFGNQATWPEGGEDLPMVLPVYPKKPEKEKKRSVTQVSVDYSPPENLVDNLPYYLEVGMLSPPEEVTQKEGVAVIVLSVFDSEEITNLDSTRMIIDSTQVSAFISSDMLTFVPIESFEPGYHIVRYESVKKNGEVLQKDFSFFVHESIFEEDIEVITWQEKYKFKGNIGWNTDIDPSPSRPFDTHKFNSSVKFILGDTKFNIQGLTNLHIIDGDARSEAEFRQPTERLKLKINSPMIDFNYGDSSPEFSEFSLKGTRIRGLNTKFKWGNWKTTFVGGETKHWVSSDTKTLSKWDSLSTYLPGESIYYNGEIWQAEILNTASIPDTSNGDWSLPEESDYTFISNDVCTEVQAALYGVDPVMGGDTLSVWNGSECEEVILYSTINMMTGLDGLEEGLLYEDVETCLQKCKVPVVYQKGSPIRNLQGFRTENDFFNHLKLGISTIRSWDVRNNNLTPFSVFHQGYAYEGNMVTAADFSLHFNHDKTVLQGEYGFSITMDQSIPDTLMLKAAHGIDAGDNLYSYSSWEGVDYCYQNNCVDINGDGKITSQPEFQSGVVADSTLWNKILKTKDTMEGYSKLLGFSLNDDILGFGEGRGISGLTGPEFGNLVKGGSDSLHLLTKRPAVKLLFKTPIPLYFTTLDVQGEFNQAPLNFVSHGSSSIQTDVRNYKSKAGFKLWKNQISLSVSYDRQIKSPWDPEVIGESVETIKRTQSDTKTGSIGLNFRKLPAINYSLRMQDRENLEVTNSGGELSDTTTGLKILATHTIGPSYKFNIGETSFSLNGNVTLVNDQDVLADTSGCFEILNHTADDEWGGEINPTACGSDSNYFYFEKEDNPFIDSGANTATYTGALSITPPIPLSINLGVGLSTNTPADRRQSPTIITVVSSKFGYKFLENALSVTLGGNYVIGFKDKNGFYDSEEELIDSNENDQFDSGTSDEFIDKVELDNNKLTLKAGLQYKFPKHKITLALNLDYSKATDNLIEEQADPLFKAKMAFKFGF